ncbi:hypothetical protein HELRODRAFT_190307 [Helobdella robusta]|uniref:RZ-type domain-containing protein n=1 Tax=Helobdella robusta TaxID=6412 RepID=T1FRW0_HELRO|nr:hypothetical protein HELRODRAFT_190307 [Helobdella robusta]ESO09860.1 hypothetical protein HELRODRAFT_190307 [Helobdella robusta]
MALSIRQNGVEGYFSFIIVDVLPTVLTLYMDAGFKLPPPKRDEVLLCNSTTTFEEIKLLWLRAMKDESGRIYCLVHAELLDYDVASEVEKSLKIHINPVKNVKFVIVCSSNKSEKSHLINVFEQFKVKCPHLDIEQVQKVCVRMIKSHRAGVGKTLRVKRFVEELQNKLKMNVDDKDWCLCSVPLHSRVVDDTSVIRLLRLSKYNDDPRIYHLDVSREVTEGVDHLLFNLLVLGSAADSNGYMWSRSARDFYLVESMPLLIKMATSNKDGKNTSLQYLHQVFYLLPSLTCWSPADCLNIIQSKNLCQCSFYFSKTNCSYDLNHLFCKISFPIKAVPRHKGAKYQEIDQLMDAEELASDTFQRPCHYLHAISSNVPLAHYDKKKKTANISECITLMMSFCSVQDPSWSELKYFAQFLNYQLSLSEKSSFCHPVMAQDMPGFFNYVVNFVISMSRSGTSINILDYYGMKRTWETSSHPYLFFNYDNHSFTFMGFIVNPKNGDVIEPVTGKVLMEQAVSLPLYQALARNRVNLNENFDNLNSYFGVTYIWILLRRMEKLQKMCLVMGKEYMHDPDNTFELTADNVKKLMAIYMRFKCNIPVIVMGETGCGKTRLIKFLCDFLKPPGVDVNNMILMKVHGGTTSEQIIRKVTTSSIEAQRTAAAYPGTETVLFFDEANTTECIGLIKEIMCDRRVNGMPLNHIYSLKFVAACNPYRKHSDMMIKRLEKAGLGYHVQADQTTDRLGHLPMRQLVYRVKSLPASLLPLVWDFGQLSSRVEKIYIVQMFNEYKVNMNSYIIAKISDILTASQAFMRQQQDECSFVSLRDVGRCLQVFIWFLSHENIFERMNGLVQERLNEKKKLDDMSKLNQAEDKDETKICYVLNAVPRSLMLALGVCYYVCLEKRKEYLEFIAPYFQDLCAENGTAEKIFEEIDTCQDVFLNEIDLASNIARNQALKENLFMMVVCIELRIPLFLVGKPGSSKSLAKTIVADVMQGNQSKSDLFKSFKSAHMVSYQCSPLSTPDGIVGTFGQCARLQKDKDLEKFVSVVVLDEVGLAEDSDRMPLKTLHPLLEDGCEGDEKPEPYKKVSFIGISNWALDPAKMNRGILVQRGIPSHQELLLSAKGICNADYNVGLKCNKLLEPLAEGYFELYQSTLHNEFFGLRDFYSLVKMVCFMAEKQDDTPTWGQLKTAIMRNFGGLDAVQPLDVFKGHLSHVIDTTDGLTCFQTESSDSDHSPAHLIRQSLQEDCKDLNLKCKLCSESRYLLILTDNYAALHLLQHDLLQIKDAIIIFGSSFPKDQEYTQVCRNINRIKVCMETGRTVVLLNLESLYESLYDALNQYYIKFGDQRFVDLGLGTQRVKCRVHESFRLIVVAEKQVVYNKFPIPLINRLEKHYLATSSLLTSSQASVASKLKSWAFDFATQTGFCYRSKKSQQPLIEDAIIGYHADAPASVVIQICKNNKSSILNETEMLSRCKRVMLQCATPESLFRLKNSKLSFDQEQYFNCYFKQQFHLSLKDFIQGVLIEEKKMNDDTTDETDENCYCENDSDGCIFVQITTHSRLLLKRETSDLCKSLNLPNNSIQLLSLQSIGTEHQFCRELRDFFSDDDVAKDKAKLRREILIVQCDSGDQHSQLIACTRYNISNEYANYCLSRKQLNSGVGDVAADNEDSRGMKMNGAAKHVLFIIQLPRIVGGCFVGLQGGRWMSYHIDDLLPKNNVIENMIELRDKTVSSLFEFGELSFERPGASKICGDEEEISIDNEQESSDRDVNGGKFLILSKDDENKDDVNMNDGDHQVESIEVVPENGAFKFSTEEFPSVGTFFPEQPAKPSLKFVPANESKSTWCQSEANELIKNCVHAAIAMLETQVSSRSSGSLGGASRKTELIDLLLNNLHQPISGGGNVAIMLLKYSNRSFVEYLECKVTPVLAYIISLLDTNQNLNIMLAHDDNMHWIKHFCYLALADKNFLYLKFSDIRTVTQKSNKTSFELKTCGCHGNKLNPMFPFSWLIKEQIDKLLNVQRKTHSNRSISLIEIFGDSEIGHFVKETCEGDEDVQRDMFERYLNDFVYMNYRSQMKESISQQIEVVKEDLRNQIFSDDLMSDGCVENKFSLVNIHVVHEQVHVRYLLFVELLTSCPQAALSIHQALDVVCLRYCTDVLLPGKEQFNDLQKMKKWTEDVESFKWNRIVAMKLFFNNVCQNFQENNFDVERLDFLWNFLGDKPDFKEVRVLNNVEKYLELCNTKAIKRHLGKQLDMKCCHCSKGTVSIQSKCCHRYCKPCFLIIINHKHGRCCVCNSVFTEEEKKPIEVDKKKVQCYESYKQRVNAFLISLVSQLCFAGRTPPSAQVVAKLMGYVTLHGHSLKINEDSSDSSAGNEMPESELLMTVDMAKNCIDPTPVVRSFLLQMLLRYQIEDVEDYLDNFFEESLRLINENHEHIVELCALCLHCFEDHFYNLGLKQQQTKLRFILNLWKSYDVPTVNQGLLGVKKLQKVALIQYGLHELAGAICISSNGIGTDGSVFRYFLIKQIARRFGIKLLIELSQQPRWHWIIGPNETNDQLKQPADRFLLVGETYRDCRDAITLVTMGNDVQLLDQIKNLNDYIFNLALYQGVTRRNHFEDSEEHVDQKFVDSLNQYMLKKSTVKNKELSAKILTNNMDGMKVTPADHSEVLDLLMHFTIALSGLKRSNSLLGCIAKLCQDAAFIKTAYLPTMPHDVVAEAFSVLQTSVFEGPLQLYVCPDGHPYTIGECGKPAMSRPCNVCGKIVGGTNHNLAAENQLLTFTGDKTKSGHILGKAEKRGPATSERDMTALQTSLVRILVHLSLYVASQTKDFPHGIIDPTISTVDCSTFFMNHIIRDLQDIETCLLKSRDDVLLVLHQLVHNIASSDNKSSHGADVNWDSKEGRKQWEIHFVAQFIAPLVANLDAKLKAIQQLIMEDKRQESNKLMKIIYEVETQPLYVKSLNVNEIESSPLLWRYRTRVSMENMILDLQNLNSGVNSNNSHALLQYFLKRQPLLRLLQHLPTIHKLHQKLIFKLNRTLDYSESNAVTINNFLDLSLDDYERSEFQSLFEVFIETWNAVRHSIPDVYKGIKLPEKYLKDNLTLNSEIAVALPLWRRYGLYSVALVQFLIDQQNQLLDFFSKEKIVSNIQHVNLDESTVAHIVTYDPDRDLPALLLANCNYSFQLGAFTKIEYDYDNMEKQIISKFISGKPFLNPSMNVIIFKEDFKAAVTFAELERRIKQVQMPQNIFEKDLKTLATASDALACFNIVVEFLSSVATDPEKKIVDFMNELKSLQLKHARSAWLAISLIRAKFLVKNEQNPLDHVDGKFKQNLSDDMRQRLVQCFANARMDDFIQTFYECILFELTQTGTVHDDVGEDFDNSNQRLKDVLYEYFSAKDKENAFPFLSSNEFPDEILVSHCLSTWLCALYPNKKIEIKEDSTVLRIS